MKIKKYIEFINESLSDDVYDKLESDLTLIKNAEEIEKIYGEKGFNIMNSFYFWKMVMKYNREDILNTYFCHKNKYFMLKTWIEHFKLAYTAFLNKNFKILDTFFKIHDELDLQFEGYCVDYAARYNKYIDFLKYLTNLDSNPPNIKSNMLGLSVLASLGHIDSAYITTQQPEFRGKNVFDIDPEGTIDDLKTYKPAINNAKWLINNGATIGDNFDIIEYNKNRSYTNFNDYHDLDNVLNDIANEDPQQCMNFLKGVEREWIEENLPLFFENYGHLWEFEHYTKTLNN